jgi:RNA-directed DNA polymerase
LPFAHDLRLETAVTIPRIRDYALRRLALFVAKRHHRARGYGMLAVTQWSPNQLGLIRLDGIVVAPRPNRPWRGTPNADGERRR